MRLRARKTPSRGKESGSKVWEKTVKRVYVSKGQNT